MFHPHPFATMLRQRAAHLNDLAARIESSAVMSLDTTSALERRLLDRNLHQLHVAADDLRDAAHRCRCRADELDLSVALAS
jgi:hypothetical protein